MDETCRLFANMLVKQKEMKEKRATPCRVSSSSRSIMKKSQLSATPCNQLSYNQSPSALLGTIRPNLLASFHDKFFTLCKEQTLWITGRDFCYLLKHILDERVEMWVYILIWITYVIILTFKILVDSFETDVAKNLNYLIRTLLRNMYVI